MKFLFETFIVILALLLILGLAYSVLSPMLEGLGIELDGIFNQFTSDESDETNKSDDTTQVSETTVPAECKHEYVEDKWFYKNETHHKAVCKICGKGEKTKEHIWGANGICTLCDYVKPDSGDTDTHECKFDNLSDETEEGYHILVCSVDGCGKTVPEDHEYGDGKWQISVEPTCTEKGEETRACTVCKRLARRDIAALGHDWKNGVCAVCKEECSHEYKSQVESCCPLDDEYHFDVISKVCSVCRDEQETISIPSLHFWALATTSYCTQCGYKYKDTVEVVNRGYFEYDDNYHIEQVTIYCSKCEKNHMVSLQKEHQFSTGNCIDCGVADPNYTPSFPDDSCSHSLGSPTSTGEYVNTGDSEIHDVLVEVRCELCFDVIETYYETYIHSFENGSCKYCDYTCLHDDTSGTCSICGTYLGSSSGDSIGDDNCVNASQHGIEYVYIGCSPYGDEGFEYTLYYSCEFCSYSMTTKEYGSSCLGLDSCAHSSVDGEGSTSDDGSSSVECDHNYSWTSEIDGCYTYGVCSNCGERLTSQLTHNDSDGDGFCDICGSGV